MITRTIHIPKGSNSGFSRKYPGTSLTFAWPRTHTDPHLDNGVTIPDDRQPRIYITNITTSHIPKLTTELVVYANNILYMYRCGWYRTDLTKKVLQHQTHNDLPQDSIYA